MPKSTALLLSAVIVSSVLLAACSPQAKVEEEKTETVQEEQQENSAAPTGEMKAEPTKSSDSMLKGKSLTTKTKYNSPAGEEEVGFTLVVDEKGVIVDAATEELGKAPISKVRQAAFAKDFPAAVKGKKLSELTSIDRVGGSSLTTGAFNAALSTLKTQM